MSNKSKFHFGSPELPYKHHSSVLRRSKRNQCENCGRFVTDQQLWHSETLGHSVCDHCYDPHAHDDHYLSEFDPHAILHEITNS